MTNVEGIYIELTTDCNLRCIHCYNDSGLKNSELSVKNIRDILDYMKLTGINTVSLSGGEPLLYSKIIEVLQIITMEYGFSTTIVTNATAITSKLIQSIKEESDISKIRFQISVDGSNDKEHDYIRGNGTFSMMERGIEILKNNNISYYFHSMIHQNNYNNLLGLIEYAIKNNVHRIEFTFLKKKGRGEKNYNRIVLPVKEQIQIIEYLQKTTEEYKTIIDISTPKPFFGYCSFVTKDDDFDVFLRIDAFGNVFPCQNINLLQLSLGNINMQSFKHIVNDDNMKVLRQKIREMSDKNCKCDKCICSLKCGRGCPGVECLYNYDYYSDECEQRRFLYLSNLSNFINNCKEK